ncbi:DUF2628 domain-containing protein [Acuticoccus sp. M5D2P5]|uniref:DUF2628 domain-containing protein n=1 Tax=Acuticoccus kalidii TaxID=2910977 RepID=UPI001F191EFA|nr:DUF2628 domain-containing protein [Acuticoccus kalidii]MCF3933966.1 DUF2628 domain-containing protein [Acuticoccus kalidii]
MAIWTVFEHEKFDPAERAEKALFVRDGFAWLAMIFPLLWLLANRMWLLFVVIAILGGGIIGLVSQTLGEDVAIIVSIGLAVWFGFEARALKRWALKRRGWEMTGVVEGRRYRNAERRYYTARLDPSFVPPGERHVTTASQPEPWSSSAPSTLSSPGVLGVFPEGTR